MDEVEGDRSSQLSELFPNDPALLDFDMEKRSLLELPDSSPSVMAVDAALGNNVPDLIR